MKQNIIFFSTFMMLGASSVHATESVDRVSALKQQYISCLGTDYRSREAVCRGVYARLQQAQSEMQQQQTIVFDKNQVRHAEAEARRQEREALARRQRVEQLERAPTHSSSMQKSHSPTTVPPEPKNSVDDLARYEIAQERQACEQVQSREVCAQIASERYQALQNQSSSSVTSGRGSESSRVTRYSSTNRESSTSTLPEKTTYETERFKMAAEAPRPSGIREPQELRKPEGIREPQELRKPQPLGQRDNSAFGFGNTTYDSELYKLQQNR